MRVRPVRQMLGEIREWSIETKSFHSSGTSFQQPYKQAHKFIQMYPNSWKRESPTSVRLNAQGKLVTLENEPRRQISPNWIYFDLISRLNTCFPTGWYAVISP